MRISDWSSDVCSSDLSHFLFQLPLTPAGIAQCYHITGRAPSLRYGSQNIKRPAQAPLVANVQYVLATPIKRMQNETTLRFDRTAAQDRHIRPLVDGKVELGQQLTEGKPRNFLTYIRSEEHTSELQSLMRISY